MEVVYECTFEMTPWSLAMIYFDEADVIELPLLGNITDVNCSTSTSNMLDELAGSAWERLLTFDRMITYECWISIVVKSLRHRSNGEVGSNKVMWT